MRAISTNRRDRASAIAHLAESISVIGDCHDDPINLVNLRRASRQLAAFDAALAEADPPSAC